MTSVVQICNMAILRLGGKPISSLTENSREAELCTVFYASCRDLMLRVFPWNFAKRRATLARLADTPPTNWTYAYALPVDYLQILSLVTAGIRVPRTDEKTPWEFGILNDVPALFCDLDMAELEYICTPDPQFFDVGFSSALSWHLASELAGPLMGKPDLAQSAKQAYYTALREAAAQNLNEQCDQLPQSEFLAIRGLA